jgi:hypothetical protein
LKFLVFLPNSLAMAIALLPFRKPTIELTGCFGGILQVDQWKDNPMAAIGL